jgi:hypothetical protein
MCETMSLSYDATRVYVTPYQVKSRIVEDPEFVCLKIRDKYNPITMCQFDMAVDEAVLWYNNPVEFDTSYETSCETSYYTSYEEVPENVPGPVPVRVPKYRSLLMFVLLRILAPARLRN